MEPQRVEQTTASERAVSKSETATTKQIDQQNGTSANAILGVVSTLNDLKERAEKIEFVKVGSSGESAQRHLERKAQGQMVAWLAAATGAFATIGSVLLVVLIATYR